MNHHQQRRRPPLQLRASLRRQFHQVLSPPRAVISASEIMGDFLSLDPLGNPTTAMLVTVWKQVAKRMAMGRVRSRSFRASLASEQHTLPLAAPEESLLCRQRHGPRPRPGRFDRTYDVPCWKRIVSLLDPQGGAAPRELLPPPIEGRLLNPCLPAIRPHRLPTLPLPSHDFSPAALPLSLPFASRPHAHDSLSSSGRDHRRRSGSAYHATQDTFGGTLTQNRHSCIPLAPRQGILANRSSRRGGYWRCCVDYLGCPARGYLWLRWVENRISGVCEPSARVRKSFTNVSSSAMS